MYRDSVEAALVDYQSTDVLLYLTGNDDPSWVPHWNHAMLFRNPFRFGKRVPWMPAGATKPSWSIDKDQNILSIQGFFVGTITSSEPYNAKYFCDPMLDYADGVEALKHAWQKILRTLSESFAQVPLTLDTLAQVAIAFAYGLDDNSEPASEYKAVRNFAAYLQIVLDRETFAKYIPTTLSKDLQHADGRAFGKPVWDFDYPESSLFITERGSVGCCVAVTEPGDSVFVPCGSTYPMVLRPQNGDWLVRGYSYVHGVMHGGEQQSKAQMIRIR